MTYVQRGYGRWVNALVALAFTLRALVPAGFMPAFADNSGLLPLVICSSDKGQSTVYLPAGEMPDAPQDEAEHGSTPCAYAASFATAAPLPVMDFAAYLYAPDFAVAPEAVFTAVASFKPYQAQAPPSVLLHA